MTDRSTLVAALVAASFATTGCPNSNGNPCLQACERGFQCDPVTATCLPSPLPQYERALPGRAVRLAGSSDRLWVAAFDASDGALVVTEIDAERNQDARIIASPSASPDRRVAIDASGRLLAVAWLGSTGRYELAYRELPSDHSIWNFATVVEPASDSYTGTQDFDLEVVGDRQIVIAFRDRSRTLRLLRTTNPVDEQWTVETVDDGSVTDDNVACPDELRRISPALGVGFYPDVESRGTQLEIAYQDADCGDLRLARASTQGWGRTAVDTGEVDANETQRAYVGSWPSIAFNPSGATRISYHDASRGRLLVAADEDGQFEISIADPGLALDEFSREKKKTVGAFSKLRIDADGNTTISYYDGTGRDLRVARRDAGSSDWALDALETDGATGFFADHIDVTDVARFYVAEKVTATPDGVTSSLTLIEEDL